MRTQKESDRGRGTHSLRSRREVIKTQNESEFMRDTHFLERIEGVHVREQKKVTKWGGLTL